MKIYVAGASAELERAKAFIARINAHPSMELTYDWTLDVEAARASNLRDSDLDDEKRAELAHKDLCAINDATVLVALIPDTESSSGLWVELGYALGLYAMGNRKIIIASGGKRRSIFTVRMCAGLEAEDDDITWTCLELMASGDDSLLDQRWTKETAERHGT